MYVNCTFGFPWQLGLWFPWNCNTGNTRKRPFMHISTFICHEKVQRVITIPHGSKVLKFACIGMCFKALDSNAGPGELGSVTAATSCLFSRAG